MDLKALREKNQHLNIGTVTEDVFKQYGRIIEMNDLVEVRNVVDAYIKFSDDENHYIPTITKIEKLSPIKKLSLEIYGGLQTQAGICIGMNKVFNGIEYHQGSETLIALTDCVLFLGQRKDLFECTYDLSKANAFYVKSGQIVELYDTTLHYTPCTVNALPFLTVVLLLKGTNEKINNATTLLRKKNKWFLTHGTAKNKIAEGNFPGLIGQVPYIN